MSFSRKIILALVLLAAVLTGCSAFDVVGRDANRAFGELLKVLPAEQTGEVGSGCFFIAAPDGGAQFLWENQQFLMIIDPAPFVAAGLDTRQLGYRAAGAGKPFYSTPSFNMEDHNPQVDPLEQFEKSARFVRDLIGYHAKFDHYNIALTDINGAGGNMFEWAKDLAANDKDIVFVLNPEPLIAAGVDPEKVEGWTYAEVTVDIGGKPEDVWKFLKSFNLK